MSNLLFIVLAMILGGITLVAIQFDELRDASTMKEKRGVLLPKTRKRQLYIVFMFVGMAVLSFVLFRVYRDNTVLSNVKRMMLMSVLWAAAFYDYKSYKIPNRLIILGLVYRGIVLVLEMFFERERLLMVLYSEGIAFVAMAVLSLICLVLIKGCLGMGDVKLFLVMSLLQGLNGITTSVFASLVVAFFASVYLLATKKKSRKDVIPFAPFILTGTFLSVLLTGM